jgi:hypothetical protein
MNEKGADEMNETKTTPKQWIEVLKWRIRALRSAARLTEIRTRTKKGSK